MSPDLRDRRRRPAVVALEEVRDRQHRRDGEGPQGGRRRPGARSRGPHGPARADRHGDPARRPRRLAPRLEHRAFPGMPSWMGPGAARTPGGVSRVRSATIEMELDHDTGDLDGTVLAGPLAGRRLATLDEAALRGLAAACRTADPDGLRLLEAYLDRRFPGWREHAERDADAGPGARPQPGAMTEEEAYQVLGLEPGAEPRRRSGGAPDADEETPSRPGGLDVSRGPGEPGQGHPAEPTSLILHARSGELVWSTGAPRRTRRRRRRAQPRVAKHAKPLRFSALQAACGVVGLLEAREARAVEGRAALGDLLGEGGGARQDARRTGSWRCRASSWPCPRRRWRRAGSPSRRPSRRPGGLALRLSAPRPARPDRRWRPAERAGVPPTLATGAGALRRDRRRDDPQPARAAAARGVGLGGGRDRQPVRLRGAAGCEGVVVAGAGGRGDDRAQGVEVERPAGRRRGGGGVARSPAAGAAAAAARRGRVGDDCRPRRPPEPRRRPDAVRTPA